MGCLRRRRKRWFVFCILLSIAQAALLVSWYVSFTKRRSEEASGFETDRLLTYHILNSSGKVLVMQCTKLKSKKTSDPEYTFNTITATFPGTVRPPKQTMKNQNQTEMKKYVYVHGRYWEQLSMNTRIFLSLASQAARGGRSVVKPRVKHTRFDTKGYPFERYFDTKYMGDLFEANGYAPLADKEEFESECPLNGSNHTTVHFLYAQEKAADYTKRIFQLTNEDYDGILNKVKHKGWTECPFIRNHITKLNPESRMLCVDTTIIRDWSFLERNVIRSSKCLSIVLWRGNGQLRARFDENHLKVPVGDMKLALKLSHNIETSAAMFKKAFLPGSYIAIHVRGEVTAINFGMKQLKKCIATLIAVVRLIKKFSHVDHVFVATDMSKHGSGSWKDSVKGETVDDKILTDLHDSIVSATNGTVFEPAADQSSPDRGVVALSEMSLLAQADTLVTVGHGSFHEWTVLKFLEFHRNDVPARWSLIKLCSPVI